MGAGGTAGVVAPVLRAEGLCFGWPGQPLFKDFSASIAPGVTWLGGDEGTGKTTLLRLFAGALAPQAGRLWVAGPVFWLDLRADGCDGLTPGECFERVAQQHPALDRVVLGELVDAFGLTPHLPKRLEMLSTGSRRKVWLAAGFASGAALTLLDQPFAALDKTSIDLVTELLQDAARHRSRAWVVADYLAPRDVPLVTTLALGG